MYLPTEIVTISNSIQAKFGQDCLGGCEGYWKLIVLGILFVLLQLIKHFKESSWLAYGTLSIAIVQSYILNPMDWLLSLLWFLGDNKEVNTNIYLHSISISAGGVMTVVAIASGVNGFISADFYGNHLWSFTRKYRTTARDAIYLNEYIVISE